jgi:D-arabinose 1-dehydrogenase-like Zn-dependent alcohol dehydrogenase
MRAPSLVPCSMKCEKQRNSGYSVNGTFAEYAVAPAAFATPVPGAVSSTDAAPLTCAGVTTYKAIKVARVAPAETVAIFGVGGLGHLALQYARIAGGFVIGVDIEDSKLAMATELGADHVVNAHATDPAAARRRTCWPGDRIQRRTAAGADFIMGGAAGRAAPPAWSPGRRATEEVHCRGHCATGQRHR